MQSIATESTVIILAALSLAAVINSIIGSRRERALQALVDRLTDKLMARDYGEYKRHDNVLQPSERERRKPISFYDDPSIETEDDTH